MARLGCRRFRTVYIAVALPMLATMRMASKKAPHRTRVSCPGLADGRRCGCAGWRSLKSPGGRGSGEPCELWIASGRGVGVAGVAGVGLGDGQQGEPEVAELVQQSVQGGLVGDGALEDGGAVVGVGEVEVVEPGRPAVVEPALDADLVPVAVLLVRCAAHGPQGRNGADERASSQVMSAVMNFFAETSRGDRPAGSWGQRWSWWARRTAARRLFTPSLA